MAMMQQHQGMAQAGGNLPQPDTAETVQISSFCLLKMLRHGRAGVPFEVMGLMLGDWVDEYTVKVMDVFAMPQRGTSMSVEAVDEGYQIEMMDMLKPTGRGEVVVGWYHSHPGWDVWLSSVDQATQESFEKLNARCVAVVVDPILSVKGKVVIDAFRLIPKQVMALDLPMRQTTSVVGHLKKPTIRQRMHGLGKMYYSMPVSFRKNELEEKMLRNFDRLEWVRGLRMGSFEDADTLATKRIKAMLPLLDAYAEEVKVDEAAETEEQAAVRRAGKVDARRDLLATSHSLMGDTIARCMGTMLSTVVF